MTNALVTGPAERVAEVAAQLRAGGYRAYSVADGVPLTAACESIPVASVACYVQLPADIDEEATGAADLRAQQAHNLVRRFDALGAVAPLLAPGASVLLVTGDDRQARPGRDPEAAVLAMLARAVLGDHGAENVVVEVRRVTGRDRSLTPTR